MENMSKMQFPDHRIYDTQHQPIAAKDSTINKPEIPKQLEGKSIQSAPKGKMSEAEFKKSIHTVEKRIMFANTPKSRLNPNSNVVAIGEPTSEKLTNKSVDKGKLDLMKELNKPSDTRPPEAPKITKNHTVFAEYTTCLQKTGLNDQGNAVIQKDHPIGKEFIKLGYKCDDRGIFYKEKTGTLFFMIEDEKNVTLCFGGLGSGVALRDESLGRDGEKKLQNTVNKNGLKEAVKNFFGHKTASADDAMEIAPTLLKAVESLNKKRKTSGKEAVVIGHSHGGGLAQCAAQAAGIQGVVFNAESLGKGVRNKLEEHRTDNKIEGNKLTSFISKGDFVSHKNGAITKLSKAVVKKDKRGLSLATPENTFVISSTNTEKGISKHMAIHNNYYNDVNEAYDTQEKANLSKELHL